MKTQYNHGLSPSVVTKRSIKEISVLEYYNGVSVSGGGDVESLYDS